MPSTPSDPDKAVPVRTDTRSKFQPVPVLLLGGQENALSLVRSLGGRGVPVRVAASPSCVALKSRFCAGAYPTPAGCDRKEHWGELLLGGSRPELRGSAVFPCCDDSIEFVVDHRSELERHYLLDDHVPGMALAMLDKRRTLDLARAAGCPVPGHWEVKTIEDIERIEGEVMFPVLIKPILSHVFQRHYGHKKMLLVHDFPELVASAREAIGRGLEIMVCEMIPGPDDLLQSYYSYIDAEKNSLFHFTKRIIRRSPVNFGRATYHITEWIPEVAEMGQRFFREIDFRGLGNVEFKRDPRDGQLKVMECNARFTAAQELLTACGMDIGWIIYNHVTGGEVPRIESYREHLRLWHPSEDLDSFRELHSSGMLSLPGWLRSIAHRQVFPYFRATDPLPALTKGANTFATRIGRKLWRR